MWVSDPRLTTRREHNTSLHRDREIWCINRASEMERAGATGTSHKLFHLIRATIKKASDVSETICVTDGSSIHN